MGGELVLLSSKFEMGERESTTGSGAPVQVSERDQYPDWCWCQYGHSAPGRSLSAEQSPCGQEERGSDSERAWPTHHTTPAPPHTTTTTADTAATQAQCSLQSHPPTTESKYEPFHLTLCLLLLSHSSLSLLR